ncbi:MAG: AMP-binding protein, partial [Actinomycetota bacterium]|nr:AMP-binding protein [Actinomycetota bacterium]
PLFHVTAQGTTLGTLARGGRITIDAEFDAFGFWGRVQRAEARVFTFVGTILAVLARLPERADDAENPVRRIVGAAAPADRWRDIERRFDLMVVETWGQTETASCWTAPAALPQRPGTVGRANWRFHAKVAGPDGEEVPRGELGEMWMRPRRPRLMFDGYLADDGTISRDSWTPDGWYRTGDLMRQHPDGDFSFVGRLRDAIRRRGEMIPAGEVEAVALACPGVREAAAVGVPADDGVEEEIKLCAVAEAGSQVTAPLLHAFLRDHLPAFMVPRYVDLRDELPTTPTTRIRKQALREEGTGQAWDARRRRPAAQAAQVARAGTDVS